MFEAERSGIVRQVAPSLQDVKGNHWPAPARTLVNLLANPRDLARSQGWSDLWKVQDDDLRLAD